MAHQGPASIAKAVSAAGNESHVRCPAAPLRMRIVTAVVVIIPFLGLVAAAILLWGIGFSWTHLGLLLGMYVATGLGITVGYHRLFTHRSFETNCVVKFILGMLGSMAVQNSVILWVAQHRRHHQLSDLPGDPHSPHLAGRGLLGFVRGLWHAHIGWFFDADVPNLMDYVPDLRKDRVVRVVSTLFPLWVLVGLLVPTILGGVITLSWMGALLGFVWGGLVRIFLVHHVTWSVNSVCHIWGAQPNHADDHSKNNFLFGLLAMGEGWHNNHHAFPTSARHGLRWWQFDLTYVVIRALALVRLARNVRVPSPAMVRAARR
ncbi:MAG: acyl-CoA desaturase [Planctomycetia bacterium]|nr:acyl-CoA desaturase [Planctomycetia bacterium]